ncbi:Cation efflux protein [Neofusicoccum parvum]|uniref:Cation efflux protein n=1 Tax=Neofusicoccum parvum TaxID=310453 RepID=A0ACB5SM51_9PEZI|nr:Cation efflux protein [Neofusicoccum parvum]
MVSSRHNRHRGGVNGNARMRPDDEATHKHRPQNDLESGRSSGAPRRHPLPPRFRFRDAVAATMDMRDVEGLKRALRDGIDQGSLEKFRLSEGELKGIRNKKVRGFYKEQNERLDDWLEVDALVMAMADDVLDSMNPRDMDHDGVAEAGGALQATAESVEPLLPDEEREKRGKERRNARWAININVVANILLLAAKCIAAYFSSSLSLIASLVDSALDLLCTLIVWTTNKLVAWRLNRLKAKFPVGRRRLEPLGILVFSIIMILSFAQILQESVQKLLPGTGEAQELPMIAIGAMAATIGLKGLIWFGCIPIKTTQVQALAQDCKTDVYFNTLSLLFPVIGYKANLWWFDPVGAALLSLFIIYDWAETSFENVTRLTGSAANDRVHRKMLYLAYRFMPLVSGLKRVTAYHAGDGIWVEMDVLLDESTPLRKAHDIAETLQYCCEALGEVDRAFVTTDYATQGPSGHVNEE